jgi:dihydroorotase (multifunctional complex type)
LVAVHAENDGLIKEFEQRYKSSDLPPDLHTYLKTRPPMVEEIAIYDALAIARWAGTRIHICHLSTAGSAEVVAAAKKKSSRVTCEVCQSHLFLNVDTGAPLMGLAKFSPPLRTNDDQQGLWEALRSGVIDQVASDHAPQVMEDKVGSDSIWKLRAGAPWLEIGATMMFDAVQQGNLAITDFVRVMCEQPARNMRLFPKKGCLAPGSDADIVVLDPDAHVKVDAARWHSKGKYSPMDGRTFRGKPVMTFVRGQEVARNGEIVGVPGTGRRLRPLVG